MGSKSRSKGFGYEREIVKEFEADGFRAKRAWGSNGRALGLHEEVDIVVHMKTSPDVHLQAKRKATIAGYIKPTPQVMAQVIREDRGDSYAVLPLSTFIKLLKHYDKE
jgi:Holliday junction resolvase